MKEKTQSTGTNPLHQSVAGKRKFKVGTKSIAVDFTDQRPCWNGCTLGLVAPEWISIGSGKGICSPDACLQQPAHAFGNGGWILARYLVRGAQAHPCGLPAARPVDAGVAGCVAGAEPIALVAVFPCLRWSGSQRNMFSHSMAWDDETPAQSSGLGFHQAPA